MLCCVYVLYVCGTVCGRAGANSFEVSQWSNQYCRIKSHKVKKIYTLNFPNTLSLPSLYPTNSSAIELRFKLSVLSE